MDSLLNGWINWILDGWASGKICKWINGYDS